ncbi:uncharacterized protein LOC103095784 [Monodelphis domestica]|uniref:uncharacterized protein LOC103095784 n=1 Tax=Monodelphis domestica TaxID=13616 RepID=UPI0024E268A9|nr:uncharacterized protein LOC103095784 [Monodelphis domestica]XP_007478245.2 uncharacterized protein LOC103095784 [Monodelphis domestica]
MREGTLASQGAGSLLWPSATPDQAPATDSSGSNKGDLPEYPPGMFEGAGPEPRGQWPGLVVIVICSLWASASLALATSTSHQQGLFSAPFTRTLAGHPPGGFSRSSPVKNGMNQSLVTRAVPQHPEVPTGKTLATGTSSSSLVIPEGSEDKGASWRSVDWQKKTLFSSLSSRLSSLSFGSRLPAQVKTLHAKAAPSLKPPTEILALGPPKDQAETSLTQVNQMDNFLTTEQPPSSQTPASELLGMWGSTESGVLQDDDRTELRHPSLSTESTPPAPTSEVQLSMKSNSRVLSLPEYEFSFALSSSKEALVSKGTYPSPEPAQAAKTRSLPEEARKAIGATTFPSLGASWGRETQSHVPKISRSLSPHNSERNPIEKTKSTTAIPAISSWPIRSRLYSRGPKKAASTSKDSFPIKSLNHIGISAIPPPTRPPDHSPRVIGPNLEFLATNKENEGYSQMRGHRRLAGSSDSILQQGIPIERYRLLSRPITSPGVFESTSTDVDASSDLGLLSLPPRALDAVRENIFFVREPVEKVSATPLDEDTPKPSSPSRLASTASSLDKAAFLTFSLSSKSLVSFPLNAPEPGMPVVTWASHGSTAHPDAHRYEWSRTKPSLDQPHPKMTSPRQIFLARTKSSGSRRVLTVNPQPIPGREGLLDFLTSGVVGGPSLELPTSTPMLQKIPIWRRRDSQPRSGFLVHRLPLHFRLSQISYHPLLANEQSAHFKRLKWEVTLTFRRMLSHMNGFQEISILKFFNGSVFVQSEVEVEGDPIPTSSDLIRSIVSMVRQKMDTHFSWRVDLSSLYSNGYGIENLEPEKLSITFMVPRFGSQLDGEDYQHLLDNLKDQVIQDVGKLYPVVKFSVLHVRETQGKLLVGSEVYIHNQAWADVRHVLQALTGLANQSVDLSSLTVAGSHLDLQLLPISFHVTNRKLKKSVWEPLCPEHQTLFRELSMVVKRALSRHRSLLQVIMQDCLSDYFKCKCVGELLFETPKPTPKSLLKTLLASVDSGGHLALSAFQVDPGSFCIAGENLEFPPRSKNISSIFVVITILCLLSFFTIFILIIQSVKLRCVRGCWHRGTFSLQAYQMPKDLLELRSPLERSGQQDEKPTIGTGNHDFEGTSEEDFGSSSSKETIHFHTRTS